MKSPIRKIFAAIAISAAITGCKSNDTSQEGKVLNIACWNEEFKTRFTDNFVAKGLLPEDIKINWIMTPNENTVYQSKLDELLVQQMDLPNDDRLDIFLVEADYALKYADTPYTLDVIKDIGLTEDDLKNQYPYTKEMMTDLEGKLKGVSWQACPGGFIYRRSIAKDVFGTDEPEAIQKHLKNWVQFDNTAGLCKEKGYYMLAGYDDAFRVFSDNAECPFVTDNKLTIPSTIMDWVSQTKIYTEKGYNHRSNLFSDESARDAGKDGKVFGYFGPAWYIDYFLAPASLQFPKAERAIGNGTDTQCIPSGTGGVHIECSGFHLDGKHAHFLPFCEGIGIVIEHIARKEIADFRLDAECIRCFRSGLQQRVAQGAVIVVGQGLLVHPVRKISDKTCKLSLCFLFRKWSHDSVPGGQNYRLKYL